MAQIKTTDFQAKQYLLKKFHTLCAKAVVDADTKRGIVESFGVFSSRELTTDELLQACTILEGMQTKIAQEMDTWRKRVIASIDGYMRLTGGDRAIEYVKGVACQSTGYNSFNSIPRERLINIYNAFLNKQKDYRRVGGIIDNDILNKSYNN